jgi:hypothetical protein
MLLGAGQLAAFISLTEGVLRTMFKTTMMLLAALGLSTGGLLGTVDAPQVDRKPTSEDARALREEVEKVRREAEMQRDRAEAERRRAEEALRALKEKLAKAQEGERQARQAAEKALYAEQVRQAQQAFGPKLEEQRALKQLAELQDNVRVKFKERRQALMEEMNKLDAEERDTLAKLEDKRGLLLKQQASPLDRILERLDRIERRLERLEQSGKK